MIKEKEISSMPFEESLKELEQIVHKIDSGQETLESAIISFERGAKLKEHCQKKLDEAKMKIEKIVNKENKETEEVNLD